MTAYLMYWAHSETSTSGTFSGASNPPEKESLYSDVLKAFLQRNCGKKNECHFLRLSKKKSEQYEEPNRKKLDNLTEAYLLETQLMR